jgi:hypothetical protein
MGLSLELVAAAGYLSILVLTVVFRPELVSVGPTRQLCKFRIAFEMFRLVAKLRFTLTCRAWPEECK